MFSLVSCSNAEGGMITEKDNVQKKHENRLLNFLHLTNYMKVYIKIVNFLRSKYGYKLESKNIWLIRRVSRKF